MRTWLVLGWRRLVGNPSRYATALAALVAAVAMTFGCLIESSALRTGLSAGADSLGGIGQASALPADGYDYLTDDMIAELTAMPGVSSAVPLLTVDATARRAGGADHDVFVTGVPEEVIAAELGAAVRGRLPTPSAPEVLAPAAGTDGAPLAPGDELTLATVEGPMTFTVTGTYAAADLSFFAGNNLFTPIQTAATLFGASGSATRVDLILADPQAAETWSVNAAATASAGTSILYSADAGETFAGLFGVVGMILVVVCALAWVLAAFLVALAFINLAEQRRAEDATIRAVGGTDALVMRAALAEAGVLSAVATALGLPAGFGIAYALHSVLSRTGGSAELPAPFWWHPLAAVLCGVIAAGVGAWYAARATLRTPITVALSAGQVTVGHTAPAKRRLALGAAALVTACAGLFTDLVVVHLVAVLAAVAAAALLSSAALAFAGWGASGRNQWAWDMAARRSKRLPYFGQIVTLSAGIAAFGVAVVGLVTGITGAVGAQTSSQFGADIQVFADYADTAGVREELAAVPGVGDVASSAIADASLVAPTAMGGTSVVAVSGANYFGVVPLQINGADREQAVRAVTASDAVIAPAGLAEQLGLRVGDSVTFTYQGREVSRVIAGTYQSLSTPTTFYGGPGLGLALNVSAEPEWVASIAASADPATVEAAVRQALAATPGVEVRTSEDMRVLAATQMVAFTGGAFGLVIIMLALAGVGLAGIMSLNVRCRVAELAMFKVVGALPGAVRRVVRTETLLMATSLCAVGLLCGNIAAAVMARMMAAAVNVALPPTTNVTANAGVAAIVVAALLLATVGPVRRATRVQPAVVLHSS